MKFPNTEGEVGKLARYMISGFRSQQEIFPAPPVPPDELQTRFATYITAREAAAEASGFAASAYTLKDEALEELVSDMKSNIRYAENRTDFDDAKLKMIDQILEHLHRTQASRRRNRAPPRRWKSAATTTSP